MVRLQRDFKKKPKKGANRNKIKNMGAKGKVQEKQLNK